MRTLKLCVSGALCALTVFVGACEDDGPIPLFDEKGTWALYYFDVMGELQPFNNGARVDKFLINYNPTDPERKIVSAASCIDSMGRTDITKSLCDTPEFECRCFTYTFEETTMVWTEFPPKGGKLPPGPEDEDSMAPKPGEPNVIDLEAYNPEEGYTGIYRYSTLPYGLFDSDGVESRFVFQKRGETLFEPTGCLAACGAETVVPEGEAGG